ncbi:MAG: (1-_4)-alpha-D-glucan 1-alpha-D-glucosylmutase, partial [Thermodesulfobacteriota bacterium]|nr:(1->4)-alpha-D-glucan 1-alpha-D-glucosylmutase [Thermodesulfobacteriota bacterium]
YRIQFSPSFGFQSASSVVPYLSELGISDLYASPIFKAARGSLSGYDVVDSNQLNPDLGGLSDLESLSAELQKHNMGWIQDIVPNHMAMNSENGILMDIFMNGHNSQYFKFFDVDWGHPPAGANKRLLAPFLGKFYGECLEDGEIALKYGPDGFNVAYYDLSFPLRIESYPYLFKNLARLKRKLVEDAPDFIKILGILYVLKTLSSSDDPEERSNQIKLIHRTMWELYTTNAAIKTLIDDNLQVFNGEKGKPETFNALDDLLSQQLFRLSFWKVAAEEINYRRFFCINDLISLRMEDERVLSHTHRLIFGLIERGIVTGLRIDHVDGLYDPTTYLQELRKRTSKTYIVVEKILNLQEDLPDFWPVQGTTGYDFANYVNELFCQKENVRPFSRIYSSVTGLKTAYEDVVTHSKRLIIQEDMASDVHNLAQLLKEISSRDRHGSDITLNALQRALSEVLAVFPVYRTYVSQVVVSDNDRKYILDAVDRARANFPGLIHGLTFLRRFLLLDFPDYVSDEEKRGWLLFVMRFQQFTGPLVAKGVEDTTLYVYNRLLSLNEVGGRPDHFGCSLEEFHTFNMKKKDLWPDSLNTTSTHDTKRGEDVRARINVLSEMPDEWLRKIRSWIKINRGKKKRVRGLAVPDRNDEYFLYQTLIGAFPFSDADYPDFIKRIKEYLVKAVREAKVHTAWLKPDVEYEDAYVSFAEKILARSGDNAFLKELIPFTRRVAHFGMLNSLSQTLIKITSPGVPDFYQGTELWDLSLVDPDNRRPVDFKKRSLMLSSIREHEDSDIGRLIQDLLCTREDGKVKLFLIYRALKARKTHREIFGEGAYVPLESAGRFRSNVITFARRQHRQWAIVIAPRLLSHLVQEGDFPLGRQVWQDTQVILPDGAPLDWRNVITSEVLSVGKALPVGDVLHSFPVALLMGGGDNQYAQTA